MMYIKNMIGYMVMALPIFLISRFIFIKIKKKRINIKNEIVLLIFVLYIVGLASQTVIPMLTIGILNDTGKFIINFHIFPRNENVNLIPFHTLYQYLFQANTNVDNWDQVSILNIFANMLLFSPMGFLVPLIWKKWDSFKEIFFLGLGITCLIEIVQLFIGRSTDIDDVILNTFGMIIGYAIFLILKKVYLKTNNLSQSQSF